MNDLNDVNYQKCASERFCPLISGDAYRCQWTRPSLIQILFGPLVGAKPLSKSMLTNCELDPSKNTSLKFNRNSNNFIHENAVENMVYGWIHVLAAIC